MPLLMTYRRSKLLGRLLIILIDDIKIKGSISSFLKEVFKTLLRSILGLLLDNLSSRGGSILLSLRTK